MFPERLNVDVLVIGAGFSGSLTALLLERIGLKAAVIERGRHPRFALGESATPLADLLLADLASRYNLPRLAALAEYGTWQQSYPELVCGLKRGFSYFHHRRGETWPAVAAASSQLMIAASDAAADADTHWLRSDFDHFLAREAVAAGTELIEQAEIAELAGGPPWRVAGNAAGRPFAVDARFLVDASGEGRVLQKWLNLADEPQQLRTRSRAIYAHFRDVRRWADVLSELGASTNGQPFPCDAAALHHVFDGGWMWVLRFNNGVTSAGWLLDADRFAHDAARSVDEEWAGRLAEFPAIENQFRGARPIAPPGGLRRTGRLQHRCPRAAGEGWVMLPTTAYTLDALHSTGNAHTLSGIERLIGVLEQHWQKPSMMAKLVDYNRIVQQEISHLDRLVHGAYRAMGQFELFAAFAMYYFIAAHNCEARRRDGRREEPLLWAGEPRYQVLLDEAYERLFSITEHGPATAAELRSFARQVADGLEPFNIAGLRFPDGESFSGGLSASASAKSS